MKGNKDRNDEKNIKKDKSRGEKEAVAAAAKSLQSCPTLCDPRDGSPPGCPIPGVLQARTLEWVKGKSLSCVQLKLEIVNFSLL